MDKPILCPKCNSNKKWLLGSSINDMVLPNIITVRYQCECGHDYEYSKEYKTDNRRHNKDD